MSIHAVKMNNESIELKPGEVNSLTIDEAKGHKIKLTRLGFVKGLALGERVDLFITGTSTSRYYDVEVC